MYLAASVVIPQLTLAFAPLMTALLANGEKEVLRQWVEHLIKWLTVGGVLVVFGVLFLGNDLVPLVFGKAYEPVAANLVLLSIALLAQILISVATLLTLIYNRPKVALASSVVRLAAFWVFGLPLVAWLGGPGGCLAAMVASMLCAGYFIRRMRTLIFFSLKGWAFAIGTGALFLPLIWFRSSWVFNVTLYGIFFGGYVGGLLLLQVVRRSEIATLWQAFLSKDIAVEEKCPSSAIRGKRIC